jgi:hypothetical protein
VIRGSARAVGLALIALLSALLGCSAPRIDTSSDDALKESTERVRQSLPEDKRADFDTAVRELSLADVNIKDLMAPGAKPEDVLTKMKQRLNGKTGDQILAEAKHLTEERAQKEREQALAEIKELVKKANAAQAAKKQLAGFVVERSRFYRQRAGFLEEPIIELSVTNKTPAAISRAYFHDIVASPGRSIPWLSDDFNHSISGGLEPGESATWKLNPNMFGAWGVRVPPDAILTVTVVRLDGPDGKALYDAEGLSEAEQARLAALLKRFP